MHSKDLMSRGASEIKNKTSKTTLYVHMEPNLTDHALPNTRHCRASHSNRYRYY